MKNILKKFILFSMLLGVFANASVVYADSAPDKFTAKHSNMSNTPVSFPQTFHVKKTSDGKYIYCLTYSKDVPNGNTFKKGSLISDNGMNYILNRGYSAKNNNEYFIYQTALWVYMLDEGLMNSSASISSFKQTLSKSDSSSAKKIKELVANAKKASKNDTNKPSINITDANVEFTLDKGGKNYVSSSFKITSSDDDYKLELVNAPEGTKYEKSNGLVYITIPASSVKQNVSFSLKATVSKNIYKSYKYNPTSSNYQTMSATYIEKLSASDSRKFSLKLNKVVVSKRDATNNEELAGAHLAIKDSQNKVVDEWVSTTEPHELTLNPGNYTLEETIAPDGYVLNKEKVSFTVKNNGTTTQVVMKNSPEEKIVTKVVISKQDFTTGEELEGAHLVVKDSNGDIVDEWDSTTSMHTITGLEPGNYTLEETIAPDGYVLSDETITFTVKEDGTTTKVTMKNKLEEKVPEQPKEQVSIPATGTYKSVAASLFGGIIVIIGSVFITKNLRKKYEK